MTRPAIAADSTSESADSQGRMVLLVQLRVTPPESVLELPELPKPKPQPA
jgi:hypothetical protein